MKVQGRTATKLQVKEWACEPPFLSLSDRFIFLNAEFNETQITENIKRHVNTREGSFEFCLTFILGPYNFSTFYKSVLRILYFKGPYNSLALTLHCLCLVLVFTRISRALKHSEAQTWTTLSAYCQLSRITHSVVSVSCCYDTINPLKKWESSSI
jgi:hypothetical protein